MSNREQPRVQSTPQKQKRVNDMTVEEARDALEEAMKSPQKDQQNLEYVEIARELLIKFRQIHGCSFSKWKKNEVFQFFNIDPNDGLPTQPVPTEYISTKNLSVAIAEVKKQFNTRVKTLGTSSGASDRQKRVFIDTILTEFVQAAQGEKDAQHLRIGMESGFQGSNAWGFIDYVLKSANTPVILVEAKEGDPDSSGLAQLLMELEVVGQDTQKTVFGFVTNLDAWILVSRKAGKESAFTRYKPKLVLRDADAPTDDELRELGGVLVGLLEAQGHS